MDVEKIHAYSPPADLLNERIILVTGANDGIGKAVAKAYAAHGATLILSARNLKRLEQVYDEIEDAGYPQPAIFSFNLETATAADYENLAATIEKEFGHLDGLLNNAGWVSGLTPLKLYDIQRWMRVMTVNLHAPFLLSKVCLPLLERSPDPSILFSTHHCLSAYWGAYGVAKHAVMGLIRIMAAELSGDKPVRVNGIDTGPTRTRLWLNNYPGQDPNDLLAPEQVVAPYLYFMGPDSQGLTSQNFVLSQQRNT